VLVACRRVHIRAICASVNEPSAWSCPCERDGTPVAGAEYSSRRAGPVRVWPGDLGWLCAVGWRVTALL